MNLNVMQDISSEKNEYCVVFSIRLIPIQKVPLLFLAVVELVFM